MMRLSAFNRGDLKRLGRLSSTCPGSGAADLVAILRWAVAAAVDRAKPAAPPTGHQGWLMRGVRAIADVVDLRLLAIASGRAAAIDALDVHLAGVAQAMAFLHAIPHQPLGGRCRGIRGLHIRQREVTEACWDARLADGAEHQRAVWRCGRAFALFRDEAGALAVAAEMMGGSGVEGAADEVAFATGLRDLAANCEAAKQTSEYASAIDEFLDEQARRIHFVAPACAALLPQGLRMLENGATRTCFAELEARAVRVLGRGTSN